MPSEEARSLEPVPSEDFDLLSEQQADQILGILNRRGFAGFDDLLASLDRLPASLRSDIAAVVRANDEVKEMTRRVRRVVANGPGQDDTWVYTATRGNGASEASTEDRSYVAHQDLMRQRANLLALDYRQRGD